MQPIVFLGLSGPYSETRLRQLALDKVEALLERIPGVASADTVGGGEREIQVQLDPRRLAAAGVGPQQVVAAIRAANVQLPGGSIDQGGWQFTVQARGLFEDVTQLEQVVVGASGQVPVRLRDVATVLDGLKEPTRLVRNDGKPGILIMVRKQSDANTVQAVRKVLAALPEVERQTGQGIKLGVIFNQGEFVEKAIGNLSNTALMAFFFAFAVLLFFLRSLRSSIIVATAIPLSVVATFAIMDAWGLTLNIISMAGLALAIGMLVDNAIVVLENIFSYTEKGTASWQASIQGTQEVATAITASTLTTVVVFLPILFVPGIAGKMFGDMAITICFSLAASLFVARTGIPLFASRLLHGRRAGAQGRRPGALSRGIGALLEAMARAYALTLAWCLRRRKTTFALVTLTLGGAAGLGTTLATEFFPRNDQGLFALQIETAVGTSLEETDAIFRRAEELVRRTVPEREVYNVDIGSGEGFVALFAKGQHAGILRVRLKDMRLRTRTQAEIEEDLQRRISAIPGASATVLQPNLFGSAGEIVVEIYGHDLIKARDLGLRVKRLLRSLPGTTDVTFSQEAGKPEVEVTPDRSRLAMLGLSPADISSTISVFFAGKIASVFREGGTEYDIRVRGPRDYRRDRRDLASLPIVTPLGASVPLGSVASVRPVLGPATIARQDQQRMVTVSCNLAGKNKDLGAVLKSLEAGLKKIPWPEDFGYRVGGQAEDFKESFFYLGLAMLAAIALVYMVMASQFESLLHPFIILLTIPLAFIGVVLALVVTRTSLSVTALIGVLVLVGVVVNNAIVLIDTINQIRARRGRREEAGEDPAPLAPPPGGEGGGDGQDELTALLESVMDAGQRRLRPILMTAATTVLGMMPLALELGEGAESWSPMARAVIGGLATSTLLTLVVMPAVYTSLEAYRIRRRARRARRRALRAQASA